MSFQARYPGPCAYGDHIEPGDLCTFDEDENITHVECHALDGPTNIHTIPPLKVCAVCRLEHRGECF